MESHAVAVGALFLCIVGISISADAFVRSSARMAKNLGMSEFVIGISLAAIGTSLPELASSIAAALQHHPSVAFGNVVGSNIANIALILGVSVTLRPIYLNRVGCKLDSAVMLTVTMLFWAFGIDGTVDWWESLLLLALYSNYISFIMRTRSKDKPRLYRDFVRFVISAGFFRRSRPDLSEPPLPKKPIYFIFVDRYFWLALASVSGLWVSAHYLIASAVSLANWLDVPENVVGLSMIAVGTSLPELVVTLAAMRKGQQDLIIGNVIGSNIANVSLVIGLTAAIEPIEVSGLSLTTTVPVMLAFTFILHLRIMTKNRIGRQFGTLSLLSYAGFMMALMLNWIR